MKMDDKRKTIFKILLITITLIIGIVLGVWQLKPPHADKSSPMYPAYERMLHNIERFAVNPHPAGSVENDVVRAQILDEIMSMGLVPALDKASYTAAEIAEKWFWIDNADSKEQWWNKRQKFVEKRSDGIHNPDDFFASLVTEEGTLDVHNIFLKLDAPDTDRGIMFVSHYDSVGMGPGAADAMVAVCAMLEAMRVQAQNYTLKNNIYFLITSGEEDGLLGAFAFVKEHPKLANKIDMVINLEARGNGGGLVLFETSKEAYSLLHTVLKSGASPVSFSLAASVYEMMPNSTDFMVLIDNGFKGINMAMIENVENYHQPTDTYENLNKSSAWHYIHTVMHLTNYFADNSLEELNEPSVAAVYFQFLPGITVLMSVMVSHLLCVLTCILGLLFIIMQVKKKQLKITGLTVFMGVLALLSIGSAVFLAAGSYLFYIPLLAMVCTMLLKKRILVHTAAKVVSGIVTLLLWVPFVYMVWVSILLPSLL
ncbi:MAG: M20/M25/M40 family metallo-hydrolase [Clostridiales bacterium]|jgi:hypothetical protein|nr:M20/M25/M40 family metallo-hydrolase [Clostridiales bacterium]